MNTDFLIETRQVSKYYENGNVFALSQVSIKVKRGEFLVVRGPSGSGKSTLLHLIGSLDMPTSGELYFDGLVFKKAFKRIGFRINNIGFVFQAFYLWPTLNVLENVMLPLLESSFGRAERLSRANSILETVGLSGKRFSSVNRISMGERQRVAIARSLVMHPALLLADEPTGNLDSKNAQNILELFKRINREKSMTIIMATHEKMSSQFCDRTLEFLDGKVQ